MSQGVFIHWHGTPSDTPVCCCERHSGVCAAGLLWNQEEGLCKHSGLFTFTVHVQWFHIVCVCVCVCVCVTDAKYIVRPAVIVSLLLQHNSADDQVWSPLKTAIAYLLAL